jgi:alkylation response protein AidB-like acyl-CoA dehydrogenase
LEHVRDFVSLAYGQAPRNDELRLISQTIWDAFWRLGLGMAAFSEADGGAGLCEPEHQQDLCVILRLLGGADLSVARLFEGHVNAISLVYRYGTSAQVVDLAATVRLRSLAAVWGADDASGLHISDVANVRQLVGRKILASGAGFVLRPIVTATARGGQNMCLLKLSGDEDVDVTGWQALGMQATSTGSIDLSGVPITNENLVGQPDDFMRQPFFSGGAWRFCAAHLGAIERLTDLFREHLISRHRGEDPYQLQRLAQCAVSVKTARFWVEEAARRFSSESAEANDVVSFVNLTRGVTERAALDVMEHVGRGTGLTAFVRPHPVERICRDLATYLRQPVPDLAMSDGARIFLKSSLPAGEF